MGAIQLPKSHMRVRNHQICDDLPILVNEALKYILKDNQANEKKTETEF